MPSVILMWNSIAVQPKAYTCSMHKLIYILLNSITTIAKFELYHEICGSHGDDYDNITSCNMTPSSLVNVYWYFRRILVNVYQTTWYYIPQNNFKLHCKWYVLLLLLNKVSIKSLYTVFFAGRISCTFVLEIVTTVYFSNICWGELEHTP